MKRSKYKNEKVVYGDETFDSRREFDRFVYLSQLQLAGVISELKTQVPYELIPAQYEETIIGPRGGMRRGKCIEHAVKYIADFVYIDENGGTVVEDAKGMRTPDYVIKRKLMLHKYGIRIKEV